jgi:signal transduction histidine kinase
MTLAAVGALAIVVFVPVWPIRLVVVAASLAIAVLLQRRDRRSAARLAVIAERRRVARDLHDGIAQDLAFIAAYASTIPGPRGERSASEGVTGEGSAAEGVTGEGSASEGVAGAEHPIATAARRALAVSRGVISDLSDLDQLPVGDALAVIAAELGERFAIRVRIDAASRLDCPPDTCRELLRIVREAIANAARHGSAKHVSVTVRQSEAGIVLRVCDDGQGLTAPDGRRAPEGFGLSSMRDRAASLGGELTLLEPASGGTELVVAVP